MASRAKKTRKNLNRCKSMALLALYWVMRWRDAAGCPFGGEAKKFSMERMGKWVGDVAAL
jgi:hypothetical protein